MSVKIRNSQQQSGKYGVSRCVGGNAEMCITLKLSRQQVNVKETWREHQQQMKTGTGESASASNTTQHNPLSQKQMQSCVGWFAQLKHFRTGTDRGFGSVLINTSCAMRGVSKYNHSKKLIAATHMFSVISLGVQNFCFPCWQ